MTFVAGTVLTAAALNSELAAKTDLAMMQNAQTGTTYSFALADASKLLTTSNASPVSVTVTKQATVTWVTGTQLRVMNLGAGVTTLVADTGVTINGNVALKQYQGGTLIRTASDVWLFVPTASSSGMDLITPTSVAGSGVTLSGGQVSFSAVTSGSINGCFTSAYEVYELLFRGSCSSSGGMSGRMRVAGADASGADYNEQSVSAQTTNVSGLSQLSATAFPIVQDSSASALCHFTMRMFRPALAEQTTYLKQHDFVSSAQTVYLSTARHALTTAYDGFTLFRASGNFTGTLRIYGLRNS